MMASMLTQQVSLSGFRLSRKQSMAEILICRPLCELDAVVTKQCMTKQAYLQKDGMFMKLTMARASSQHVWINYKNLGKIEYHVKNLPEIFYSKSRARSVLRIQTLESPARRGRVTRRVVARSPEPSFKTMGQRWAETRIWLKARSYNYYCRTCSVRQVQFRVRAGHSYEPAGTLRAAGRQPPYIKGRPGSGLRATTISSRAGHSS